MLLDEKDQPKIYYHGTRRIFDRFGPNEIGLIHFSELQHQAQEFSQYARGDRSLPVGPPRIISAHLQVESLLDTNDAKALAALSDSLDWQVVIQEAEELSQAPWTIELAQEWLAQGQWQMLELPSVLSAIREQYDGMLMRELGAKNIAVFCADQITVVDIQTLPEPKRPSLRC